MVFRAKNSRQDFHFNAYFFFAWKMSLQEEIHLRFCLKFAMVSCDKLVYTICDGAISFPDSSFLPWVNQAWRDIPEEMVRCLFKTCGTSAMHSTAQKTMQSSTRIFQNKKRVKTRKCRNGRRIQDRQRGRRRAIRSILITQQHERLLYEPPSNKNPYYTNNNFSSFYK